MRFTVHAGDGGKARMADKITFHGDQVKTILLATGPGLVIEVVSDSPAGQTRQEPVADISAAADEVARCLLQYQGHSLVVHPTSRYYMRGNEATTADVYPPGRHPRIVVEK